MIGLVVIGDGRRDFLEQTVLSIDRCVNVPLNARIMVNDSEDPGYTLYLEAKYPQFKILHGGRRGMAGAVQAGFDLALAADVEYVLWVEEDHMLIRELPLVAAIEALDADLRLAQMVFPREPCDPTEGDDQLAAVVSMADEWGTTDAYTWHDFLFSMVPCLIPRRVLELGWPSGPLGVGNETGMTNRCLDAGYVFGAWGHVGDAPYVRHIGYGVRAAGYRL